MVALTPATPWIPKDDILLKNAIEAGASLESLARGAVQFSRRFNIKELQDRWHTLLYDPIISAEASARIVEFERYSKANHLKEAKYGKRKAESIRRCYYAMRKRICNDSLNHGDLSFLVAPGDNCFLTGPEGPGPQSMLGDAMQDQYGLEGANLDDLHRVFPEVMTNSAPPCGVGEFSSAQQNTLKDPIQQNIVPEEVTQMGGSNMVMTGPSDELVGGNIFQENGLQTISGGLRDINTSISECEISLHHLQYASSPPTMPDWKNNEGISVSERPEDSSIRGTDIQPGDQFSVRGDGGSVNKASEYDDNMSCTALKESTDCKEGYFAELSDSLFNFSSDDEMVIINDGEDVTKDAIDKTYRGLSSLLLNPPDDPNEDTVCDMSELEESSGLDDYHNVTLIAGLECDVNHNNSDSQMPMSASKVNPELSEICDDAMFCTLNIEDREIPCNDHITVPNKTRHSLRRTQSEANNLSAMKREAKRSGESHQVSDTTDRLADGFGVKFDASSGETQNGLKKLVASQGGLCQSNLVDKNKPLEFPLIRQPSSDVLKKSGQVAAPSNKQMGCGGISQEVQTTSTTQSLEFYALGSADPLDLEPGEDPSLSEDEQFSESDTDIPYFYDIESMILDMDLGPEDQDCLYSTEVAKYQHEDAKREIIRLEQNASSYIQRAIAAHRAFAILYGRHSKHYIKKAEVLLGRGTHDVPVDIDLSREGRANKISRRQAILKLEKDGTFILRNMGKCSIYVNNKEVLPGLTLGLQWNCLIEIRGMPFIFETNRAMVKKYLDNAAQSLEAKRPNIK